MKIQRQFVQCVAGVMAITCLTAPVHAAVTLPASAALPTNSVSNPGFTVRTAQATNTVVVANSFLRATRQINGLLTDTNGALVANIADAGPNPGGVYFADTISFERDGAQVEPKDAAGDVVGSFPSVTFGGIPNANLDGTDQFADESVALVVLEPGVYTLAISANADRTDVNDDDGVSVFVGANPRDFFATKIADFQRGAGAAGFTGNQYIENQIEVVVPVRGAYPYRLVHWQQGRGANLQFYLVNTNSQARVLINDTATDPAILRAYRSSTNAVYNSPYIADIVPSPGSAGNGSSAQIAITLFDGTTTVNTGNVQLSVNGTTVVPQILSKVGTKTTIKYSPNGNWATANNAVRLVYADSGAVLHTNTWNFTVNLAGASSTQVTGQWDFDFGDLGATVGIALAYIDPTFDGPTGSNPNKTQFGTTTSFGIADINGQVANVMEIPGDLSRKIGYVMTHGIAPNGGGTKVNQYTLIMDVFVDTAGPGAASLWNVGASLDNTDDGDLFWQGNNFGQGGGGYNGTGQFTAGAWHRVVAAYDEAANPPVVTKYVDGIKQDDWTANQGLDNARRAMQPTAILFGDGDQDERRKMWVNSVQIRAGKLSDAECVLLGGPSGSGIPVVLPTSTVTGQWDFDRGNLAATIGKPLQYLDPAEAITNLTLFGNTTTLGQPLIEGQEANIMQVPGDLNRSIGYIMTHGIAPNGGGTKVNEYTLIMDVLVDTSGPGAASLWNVGASLDNTDDGDLFWQGSNFGQGGGGYNGTGAFTAGAWHRVAAAYNMAATPPVVTKYVDGIFQDDWTANQGLDNARRAMQPTAILFGDGDQDERRIMWVNSIQIRNGALSKAELAALGAPSTNGIPVYIPVTQPPKISYQKVGNQMTLTWPVSATGYTLKSSATVGGPYTTAVPGVVNNSAVVTVGAGSQFFRLEK
jgi:hypothetical protein